jgi:DNA-binding beta-propeller fold protein YncE
MGYRWLIVAVAALAAAARASPPVYEYDGEWGKEGAGIGEFRNIGGIVVAAGGHVYVTDFYGDPVQYFSATGSYLGQWGTSGAGNGQFHLPGGLDFASNGYV